MKIGIAGAGAVGCHYGSFLQQSGCDASYFSRGDHLTSLQKSGLVHLSNGEETVLDVHASDDVSILSDCDVILLTCKTTALHQLCEQLAPVVGERVVLVTVQNGVAAPDQVAVFFPNNPMLAASAFIGVRIERPGVVVHSAAGHIRLGVWQNESEHLRSVLKDLVAAWQSSGVDAEQVPDMKRMLWHKMVWNCGFNAITALTRRYARDIAADEDSVRWVKASMQEVIEVAAAESVELPGDAIEQHLALTMKAGPVKTSMWQDMEHGRPTEIEAMNGYIVKRAEALGLNAPTNDLLSSLVRAAERGEE